MKKFNATQIKYLMAALMVLDHLPHIPGLISPWWQAILHAITRCVAAWFAYTAVEGFIHTSNLKKYVTRLWGWAAFMAVGNFLLNWLFEYREISLSNNIFLTLAVGVSILALLEKVTGQWSYLAKFLAILLFGLGLVLTEGGFVLLPFMLITYYLREKLVWRNLAYLLLSLALLVTSFQDYGNWDLTLRMLLFNGEFLFITVLPFLYLYNGERGPKTAFNKYFFYVFYPLHLWVIAIVAYLLAGNR